MPRPTAYSAHTHRCGKCARRYDCKSTDPACELSAGKHLCYVCFDKLELEMPDPDQVRLAYTRN